MEEAIMEEAMGDEAAAGEAAADEGELAPAGLKVMPAELQICWAKVRAAKVFDQSRIFTRVEIRVNYLVGQLGCRSWRSVAAGLTSTRKRCRYI